MDESALIDLAVSRLGDVPEKSLRLLITRLRRDGRVDDANHAIDALQERSGETGPILDLRADLLERTGNMPQARLTRELRSARFPDALAWIRLARHLIDTQSQDRSGRLADIDRELGRLPESAVTVELARGEVALARERLDEAQTIGMALLSAAPAHSRPLILLARIALARGDRGATRKYLEDALRQFGTHTSQSDLARLIAELPGSSDLAAFANS